MSDDNRRIEFGNFNRLARSICYGGRGLALAWAAFGGCNDFAFDGVSGISHCTSRGDAQLVPGNFELDTDILLDTLPCFLPVFDMKPDLQRRSSLVFELISDNLG